MTVDPPVPGDPARPDLAELRALWEAGTPGKWKIDGPHSHLIKGCLCLSCEEATGWWLSNMPFCDEVPTAREAPRDGCRAAVLPYPDAALIVAMHAALPQLLDELEASRRTIEVMNHPRYNEMRALAAEPNTSNQITAADVRKRLFPGSLVEPRIEP